MSHKITSKEDSYFFKAEARSGRKVIGGLHVRKWDTIRHCDPDPRTPCWQVSWIEVDPEFRRQGVATQLYEAALRAARRDGFALCSDRPTSLSPEAEAFWQKQEKKGRARWEVPGPPEREGWNYDCGRYVIEQDHPTLSGKKVKKAGASGCPKELILFGKDLKHLLYSKEHFESLIPPWADTWTWGGCWTLAEALQEFLGPSARLVAIKNGDFFQTEHVLIQIGDCYLDGDGASTKEKLFDRWAPYITRPYIEPWRRSNAGGISCDWDKKDVLIRRFEELFGDGHALGRHLAGAAS